MSEREGTAPTPPAGAAEGADPRPPAGAGAGATLAAVEAAVREAFAPALAAGDLSLIPDGAGGLDLSADAWTLHLDGWPGPTEAWLAADDEPEDSDPATVRDLLQTAIGPATLAALAALDARLGGPVAAALRASGDPLSTALADAISVSGAGRG